MIKYILPTILFLVFCTENVYCQQEVILKNKSLKVEIYPNPAQENLYLDFSESYTGPIKVALSDIIGNKLFLKICQKEKEISSLALNIANLAEGLYFLSVKYNEEKYTYKIIKK